jgi:DNA-binding SARP family transcriptional activator
VAQIGILGSLIVHGSSATVEVTGPRRRALLIRLLLSANEVVPTGELIEDLWGAHRPRTVVKSLQVQIGQLRRQLAEAAVDASIVTRGTGYSLDIDRHLIDAVRFEQMVQDGRSARADGRLTHTSDLLHDALRLWRGRALVDVEHESFAQGEIARLEELRLVALEERFEVDLARGAHGQVATDLESFLHVNGLRERAWGQLMVAYYRCGRQADALRAYQRAGAQLQEIGLEPGPELRALERQVLDQAPALEWQPSPAPAPGERSPGPEASAGDHGRQRAAALPPAADVGTSIVGRDDELRIVAAGWGRARRAHCPVVLVEGDPGIGKTRVVAEAAARIHRSGGTVLWGRCDESPTNPYQPFTEALEHVLRGTPDDQIEDLVGGNGHHLLAVVSGLAERLGGLTPPVVHNSDHDRILVFDAVAATLDRLLERAPVLIVIDDIHWASSQTVHLLRHLLGRPRPGPVMVMCTYRLAELERSRDVRSLLAEAVRDHDTTTVVLDDLSVEDVEDLVREVGTPLDVDDPVELARLLHGRSGGNPLLSTQLLRAFADATPAHRAELMVATRTHDAGQQGIPSSIRLIVRERTDRLSPDAVHALQVASVMGFEFDVEVLQMVLDALPPLDATSGTGPVDLMPALEALVGARLINEGAGGTEFSFAHSLVRDAIYSELSVLRRARAHHKVADALVASAHPAPAIARHYGLAVLAGARPQAIEWLERAVLDHMKRFAYDDARQAAVKAIAMVESEAHVDRSIRARLRLLLARCTEMLGDQAASRRHAEDAAADARASASTETLVHAAIQRAGFAQPDSFDETAAGLFQQALDAAGDERPDLRALVLSRAALCETLVLGPSRATDVLALEALELARTSGNRRVLHAALAAYVLLAPSGGDLEEQRSVLAEMAEIERSQELEVEVEVVHGAYTLPVDGAARLRSEAMTCLRRGDVEAFDLVTAEIAELGRARRDWFLLAIAEASRALRAHLDGRFDDMARHLEEMGRLGGNDHTVRNYMNGLGFVLARDIGRVDDLEPWLLAEPPRPAVASITLAALALLYLFTGRPEDAYRVVDDFLPVELDGLTRTVPPSVLASFAVVCCHVHDTRRAAQLYDLLVPYTGQLLVLTWTYTAAGAADRYLGLLAAELGREEEAEERFAAAVRFEGSLPSPPLVARTKSCWGSWLVGHSDERRRQRGRALLEEAACEARRMGMAPPSFPDADREPAGR